MNFTKINPEELKEYLLQGQSYRDIAKIYECSPKKIEYVVKKYDLNEFSKYQKPIYKNESYFRKIDTIEKAYILGFILGDGHLSDRVVEVTIAHGDKEILEIISNEIGCNIHDSFITDKEKRRFPRTRICINNTSIIKDVGMLFGGRLKQERHIPIISKELEPYLLKGFFDAEGCICFGYRKDRDRLWHKVQFTSQLGMLTGIQNILLKRFDIATRIYPKYDNRCYVMDISNKESIFKFIENIPRFGLSRKTSKIDELYETLLATRIG